MATNFPRTLAPQPPEWVNPYDAQIAAFRQQMAQPQAAMFTPEQIQQRRDENQQQYALGLLGQLSGDEGLTNLGGQVLKQALAARAPRVTERGVADPLTGQFQYNPDYLRERDEATLNNLESRRSQAEGQYIEARQRAADRMAEQQARAQDQLALRSMIAANGAASRQAAQDARAWTAEDRMGDDYRAETKSASQVVNAGKQLQALASQRDASGNMPANAQIAFVFSFMKMLDPGSVVREGEYATAKNAAGVPDRVRNAWNQMMTGQFLNQAQVNEMLGAANTLTTQANQSIASTQQQYAERARRRGLSADNITGGPVQAGPGGNDPLNLRKP